MSRIVVCLDCPEYQKGGRCQHHKKIISALATACNYAQSLNKELCLEEEKPIEATAPAPAPAQPTTKTCQRCGKVLPIAAFDWINYKDSRKRRLICSTCYHAAMSKTKNKPVRTDNKKVCSKCGRELPKTEFYAKAGSKDGLQSCCRDCHNAASKISREKKNSKSCQRIQ